MNKIEKTKQNKNKWTQGRFLYISVNFKVSHYMYLRARQCLANSLTNYTLINWLETFD